MNNRDFLLYQGDCIAVMRTMATASVDSIVTDPPYELGFMGKGWDSTGIANSVEMWTEALRVLKPGGHLLAFSGSRTYHRIVCAIEDAGFEVRDQIARFYSGDVDRDAFLSSLSDAQQETFLTAFGRPSTLFWTYGSGFPKSLDVSKAIDKYGPSGQVPFAEFAAHYEERRKVAGLSHAKVCAAGGWHGAHNHGGTSANWANGYGMPTVEQWAVLQPLLGLDGQWAVRVEREQYEREVLGLKPGTKLAVAPGQENDRCATQLAITGAGSDAARQWDGWGTALKPAHEPICVARKPLAKGNTIAANVLQFGTGALNIDACRVLAPDAEKLAANLDRETIKDMRGGKLIGGVNSGIANTSEASALGRWPANLIHDGSDEVLAGFPFSAGQQGDVRGTEPSGVTNGIYGEFAGRVASAARNDAGSAARFFYTAKADGEDRNEGIQGSAKAHGRNLHPTVKPTDLMRYLCRLVTPSGGLVLDPFMGSGSTGKAAVLEGFCFVGIDLSPEYVAIARVRIDAAVRMGYQPSLNLEAA